VQKFTWTSFWGAGLPAFTCLQIAKLLIISRHKDWRATVLSNHSDGYEFGLVPADVLAEDLEYLEPKDAA
jgi:hypothetical protein